MIHLLVFVPCPTSFWGPVVRNHCDYKDKDNHNRGRNHLRLSPFGLTLTLLWSGTSGSGCLDFSIAMIEQSSQYLCNAPTGTNGSLQSLHSGIIHLLRSEERRVG